MISNRIFGITGYPVMPNIRPHYRLSILISKLQQLCEQHLPRHITSLEDTSITCQSMTFTIQGHSILAQGPISCLPLASKQTRDDPSNVCMSPLLDYSQIVSNKQSK